MADFSSLGELEKTSKPNDELGENQGLSCQSLPNDVGFQLEVQNDAICKENQGVEVQMPNNDLGSIGNVVDEVVQMNNVISDVISLEGLGLSLDFDQTVENRGEGGALSVQGEQLGGSIFLDGVDVGLDFQHASGNQVEGAHVSVQGEQLGDGMHEEGGDDGLKSDYVLGNELNSAHVTVHGEELGDGIHKDEGDVGLSSDYVSGNEVDGAHVSVQGEEVGDGMHKEGGDDGLKSDYVLGNEVDGAHVAVHGEELGDGMHKDGGDVGFKSDFVSGNEVDDAQVSVQGEELGDGMHKEGGDVGLKSDYVSGSEVDGAHVSVQGEVLGDVSVQGEELGDVNVQGKEPGDVSVHGEELGDVSVQGGELGDASVQGGELGDVSVQGGELGDVSVQGGELGDASVQGGELGDVSVQGGELGDVSVQGGELGDASVQGGELGDVSVQGGELGDASVESEGRGDGMHKEGGDFGLKSEDVSGNQVEGAHVSVQGEEQRDGVPMEGEDVILNVEYISENKVECVHVSVEGEQPGGDVSLEGEDASLKCEHVLVSQGEVTHPSVQDEEPRWKETNSEAGLDNLKVELNVETKDDVATSSQLEGVHISLAEQVEKLHNDVSKNCGKIEENEHVACDTPVSPKAQSTPPPQETGDKVRIVVLASPVVDGSEVPRRGRKPGKAEAKPSVGSNRALCTTSKTNSNNVESNANLQTTKGSTGKRGKKKGKEQDGKPVNEFSRMKKHLKYLLHRIRYEQNLLEAYSSEGWRGQSVEKLRPEKELQRAKADINRSKLKIRNLFQRIDSMSAEGKFPESLYDSEGLIDSEDIFCAKCGSKDLPVGNDIILCDGICERGFHQYCLDPPLRTEEIPPGDEGWLCPACDCKHDCVDLINDSQGTKLSIEDSWEKVFPEAVAAMAGKELDDVTGLPSDDSEDNEYNPDGTDDDANVEGNESRSDQSDSDESDSSEFSSASEDLGAICGAEQNLGLPSDDSEDDDFDPDAKHVNEEGIEPESSSSDFTSASEDLGAAIDDDGASGKDEPPLPMELEQEFGESSPITSKRCVERLDYKKLFEETYGNAASDSSDDEEWTDMISTRKRKSSTEKSVSASAAAAGACGSGTPRRSRLKANLQAANGSPVQLQESSPKTSSGGTGKRRPPYNRLGEAVTQRLYVAFKENQYPDRETKEKLANELGLTAHRVDKWFGNARWSFNHHPSRVEASMSRAVPQSNTNSCNGGESDLAGDAVAFPECGGSADTSKFDSTTPKSTRRSSRSSRKKSTVGDEPTPETKNTENSREDAPTVPLQTPDASQGRVQRKRRKAGASKVGDQPAPEIKNTANSKEDAPKGRVQRKRRKASA